MNVTFGNNNPFAFEYAELGHALIGMERIIKDVAKRAAAENPNDDRTLFVVTACPCCDHTGIPQNRDGVILVTPYRGIDPCNFKIKTIDIYPPFRNCDGTEEAKDEAQFAAHWKKTLEEAIK